MARIEKNGLAYDKALYDFLTEKVLPGTNVDADAFFEGFAAIVGDLAPKNRALLKTRDAMQEKLDAWYRENGAPSDMAAYEWLERCDDKHFKEAHRGFLKPRATRQLRF